MEKAIVWLDRITVFSLYALIFTLPFSKSMVEIFFVAAAVSWAVKRWAGRRHGLSFVAYRPVGDGLNLPIGIFISLGFLSTLTSVSLPLSLEGFFFKLLEGAMIFFIVAETINDNKRLNGMLFVMLFSMFLITVDGLVQLITGADFLRGHFLRGWRIQASFDNPNNFAAWLIMMTPIALMLMYHKTLSWVHSLKTRKWRGAVISLILCVITALLITCLALTYTRGAWIATVLALVFLAFLRSKKLLVLLIIVLLIVPFVTPEQMKDRALTVLHIDKMATKRPYIWQEALSIVKDFPLLGCGLNTYTIVAPRYKLPGGGGHYPHNSYLHMAAESGLLGLGAFLWIILVLFRKALANLVKIKDGFHGAVLAGLLAGLFAFLAHSFVDTNFYSLQLGNLMWFIMGLIVAIQKIAEK